MDHGPACSRRNEKTSETDVSVDPLVPQIAQDFRPERDQELETENLSADGRRGLEYPDNFCADPTVVTCHLPFNLGKRYRFQ